MLHDPLDGVHGIAIDATDQCNPPVVDGRGELFEPETWFRFNCGSPGTREAQRRMLRESGLPLSADIVGKIEELHRAASDPDAADSQGGATL